ncbi:M56 family metallopeptidase [Cesiribacter andamanensis]|uniref:TonB C-terminal domain-containing protein n=1 Tax=Cesiribacter andamanensis AMV16 TaxID=1279009 RepID=M7NAI9_9BACT|nr:M56 family metallopeptidase [Cesiribacter andamanensis]EMR04216.1 hypothetical protein ADICEAN_00624 [Cesiribacter andamanensis AMV16]
MTNIVPYLLTASVLLAVLYAGYYVFLRNQKAFAFTRFYLLGSLFLSLLHPLLSGLLPGTSLASGTIPLEFSEQYLPALVISPTHEAIYPAPYSLLLWGYLAGCGLAGMLFLVRLTKLGLALRQLRFRPGPDGFWVAHTRSKQSTYSFFHYLALNPAHFSSPEEYQLVLQHEQAHARQWHSADVLLGELATIILWFHPGIYLLNRALRQTHEHLADAAVIMGAASARSYINLMARQGLAAAGFSLSSHFFQSFTINRIRMINNPKNTFAAWRLAAPLLIAASLTAFVACEKESQLPPPPPPSEIYASENTPPPPPPVEIQTDLPNPPINLATHGLHEFRNGADVKVEFETLPEGGMQDFYLQLKNNIRYPKEALDNGIEGTTYISFVVDVNGNVESAESIEGRELGYGLDEEAIRVIKSSKWTPAKNEGKAVKQRKVLPVKFTLDKEASQKQANNKTSVRFKQLLKLPVQSQDAC